MYRMETRTGLDRNYISSMNHACVRCPSATAKQGCRRHNSARQHSNSYKSRKIAAAFDRGDSLDTSTASTFAVEASTDAKFTEKMISDSYGWAPPLRL
jgi:hypothetical protein